MSAIYCTTRTRETSVPGRERARAMHRISEITARMLELDTDRGDRRAGRILPDDYYPYVRMCRAVDRETRPPVEEFSRWAATMWLMGQSELRIVPGPSYVIRKSVETATTQSLAETVLNTAIAHGTEAEAFLARLSGSVEDGMIVPAEDRTWLAGVITTGVGPGGPLEGAAQRWLAVAFHLADSVADPGPALLTCSQGYSVRDLGAKAAGIWDIKDDAAREEASEQWSELPLDERWDRSIDSIIAARADTPWLVLTPDTFRDKNYAQGYCAADAAREHDAWWKRNVTDQLHRVTDFDSPTSRVQAAGRTRPFDPARTYIVAPRRFEPQEGVASEDFLSLASLARDSANASRSSRKTTRYEPAVPAIEERDFDPLTPGHRVVADPIRGVYRNVGVGREHIGPDTGVEEES
ncbi:Uncharacterised protein (plasmid) [Tsukamurella tyrosinosolvens]|uniref:Uncharacterized protein n=1 Tax=Tsukamurella tyrosinosolvens TaxID=57704 RepID=A0A1H4UD09_TSUTY|nr:hypothetical protein [Tsukamurella tyrosinosolvens]SEC66629.1 hypothetical protein SAMN04489793_2860 [Tsukamurella tyrosinosolvens]VEH94142.1 Uncharacterised protein [Tsukamurella tyrosinosolvens]